ncbi:hypothetical protein [Streptomyces sp. CA-111067]|uniref:hypothetical protein n=1 Tax=Streptomyces sp. CA-111067 TaxID=3240046 RepID=UPI003D95ED8D
MSARIGQRMAAGSMVLLRGLPKIIWAGEWRETLARWVVFGVAASLALTAMALHPWLMPAAFLLGCVAAAVAGAAPDEEEAEDDEPVISPAAFLELLHDVAGGGNVHLRAVRERLDVELPDYEWTGPVVTAMCEEVGATVRKGVRVAGAQPAVTTGIHRDDLPPLPRVDGPPPVGVVSADQDSNNNTNTWTATDVGQGGRVLTYGAAQKGRR